MSRYPGLRDQISESEIERKRLMARKGGAYKAGDANAEAEASLALSRLQGEQRDLTRLNTPVPSNDPNKINASREQMRVAAARALRGQIDDGTEAASAPVDRAATQLAVGQQMQAAKGIRPNTEAMSPESGAIVRGIQRFAATEPYMNKDFQASTPSLDQRSIEMQRREAAMRDVQGAKERLANADQVFHPLSDDEWAAMERRRMDAMEAQQTAAKAQEARYAERRAELGQTGAAPISAIGVTAARGEQDAKYARDLMIAQQRAGIAQAARAASGTDAAGIKDKADALAAQGALRTATVADESPVNAEAKRLLVELGVAAANGDDIGKVVKQIESLYPSLPTDMKTYVKEQALLNPDVVKLGDTPSIPGEVGSDVVSGIVGALSPGGNPVAMYQRAQEAKRLSGRAALERLRALPVGG